MIYAIKHPDTAVYDQTVTGVGFFYVTFGISYTGITNCYFT